MYLTKATDCDNETDDYNDSLSIKNNCTNNEINTDIFLPILLLTIPCGLSFFFDKFNDIYIN